MKSYTLLLLCCSAFAISSCFKKEIIEPPHLGEIDNTTYVAIGTNSTAGYADDALYEEAQEVSYANIIATQMTGDFFPTFGLPLIPPGSGINENGDTKLVMGYKTDCNGETSLSPIREATTGNLSDLTTAIPGPYNNMGVPNAGILHIGMTGYGNPANASGIYNPWYERIASNPSNSSILQDAVSQSPTFFSIMVGDADIMTYATRGGTGTPIPPANGAIGVGFDGSLEEIVNSLNVNNAHGVISNIPDLLAVPYFNLVPYNGLVTDSDQTETLNNVFNPIGITFQEGANGFTMEDANEPFGVRKMVEGELICLSIPLDSVKCFGMGSIVPIPDRYVLTLDEITEIENKIAEYNTIINAIATANNLALADTKTLYDEIGAGATYNGVSVDDEFVTGGFYSLDGRNLSPLGQALLANAFITAMNTQFNARIPYVSLTQYVGMTFP